MANLLKSCLWIFLLSFSTFAHASIFSGDTLDAVANAISWVVLFFVPVVVIYLFWIVHIMPEKIAEKRHHPQKDAIHTLCMLSLFFGGLLWPIAWLWAYSKPVLYKMAYGTDKHPDAEDELTLLRAENANLKAASLAASQGMGK